MTPLQLVVARHGAINKECKEFLDSQIANGTVLKSKEALAILWACFNAFNQKNGQTALKMQHKCAPSLYYNFASGELVVDASNGKHYHCSKFKHYYNKPNPNATHQKHIARLIMEFKDICEPLVKIWAKVLGKGYKFTGFQAFLEKIVK